MKYLKETIARKANGYMACRRLHNLMKVILAALLLMIDIGIEHSLL